MAMDPRMRTLDIRPHGAVKHHQATERSGSARAFDKTMGKISDRTKVIAVKVTGSDVKELDIAIIKATNHNKVPPKEKHVRTLIDAVKFGNRFTTDHILKGLPKRPLTVKKWLIAIKCCITYHRLIRETNGIFIDTAAQSQAYGPQLGLFKDNVSNSAWDFSAFVREYSRYMEKLVRVYHATGYFPEQEAFGTSSKFRDMEMGDLLTHLPQLSALMEEATVCLPERAAVTSGLVQIAIMLVLKECTMMYKSSEEAMMNIVDKFFSLSPEDATKVLVVYKGNQAAKEKLVQFMDVCKASGLSQGINLPAGLQGVPEDFMRGMEDHAAGLVDDDMPPVIEMPEIVEEKEETPVAEPEPEVAPPSPVEQPDLMCLDTPRAAEAEEKPKPFEEPEDELTSLWKDSHGNGAPFAHAPPTGYIPTNAFLAGPTGMLAHGNNPNNPFLMPTPAPPPAQPQAPTYGPGSTGNKVTNVLGDLGLETLGIRKVAVTKSAEPMRKVPAQLALEYNPSPEAAPQGAPAHAAVSAPALHSPGGGTGYPQQRASNPIIPPTPYYAPPSQQQYAAPQYQQQHTGYGAPSMSYQAQHTGYGQPPQGFQQQPHGALGQPHTGGYFGLQNGYGQPHTGGYQPQQGEYGAPQGRQTFPLQPPPAVYGASMTGAPAPGAHQPGSTFGSAATGPAQSSNPFGGNAFGNPF